MQTDLEKQNLINDFITTLPITEAVYGYGSAILKQVGNDPKKSQIDLLVVTDDETDFHIKNMKINPSYYSEPARKFFLNKSLPEQHLGADVCYLSNIQYKENNFKIGVISRANFIDDLKEWKNLYMAGRFQKPMLAFKTDPELDKNIMCNRHGALLTALLLFKDSSISLFDLYQKIASLSYLGDSRVELIVLGLRIPMPGEDPNKVANLVANNYIKWNDIYLDPKINHNYFSFDDIEFDIDENLDEIEQRKQIIEKLSNIKVWINYKKITGSLCVLPRELHRDIMLNDLLFQNYQGYEDKKYKLLQKRISDFIEYKNQNVTIGQTIKGWEICGFKAGKDYALRKIKKSFTKKLSQI